MQLKRQLFLIKWYKNWILGHLSPIIVLPVPFDIIASNFLNHNVDGIAYLIDSQERHLFVFFVPLFPAEANRSGILLVVWNNTRNAPAGWIVTHPILFFFFRQWIKNFWFYEWLGGEWDISSDRPVTCRYW